MRHALYLKHSLAILACLVLLSGIRNFSRAQTVFCPPNLDFELGNLSNWRFYTGNCCPLNANTSTSPVTNRHVLTSGTGLDQYGQFPIVAPGGGSYSLKLGNNSIGSQSERARYYIRVPSAAGNYIFIYRYAVVFQDPSHVAAEQPRFQVNAYDSATLVPVPCNQFTFVASSSLPGFTKSTVGTNVYYKPWATASIDLTGYNGKTIALDFASGDCGLGAHFGYGYVDMNCGLFQIRGVSCNGDTTLTLTAPPGFQYYKWMDTTFTNTIGTTQTVVIPKANAHRKYAIIVTPYTGFGCADTFLTTYVEDTIAITASAWPDTAFCKGKGITLQASAVTTGSAGNFQWYPSAGLSCTSCKNPYASPADTTTYHVIVSNDYGCKDTADVTINIFPSPKANAGVDTGACLNDSLRLTGTGNAISHTWYPLTAMTGATTLTPKVKVTTNRTYNLAMLNSYGCRDTDAVAIQVYPSPVADAGTNKSACPKDSATLSGTISQGSFLWYPAAGLSSTTTLTPRAVSNSGTPYYLTVTNSYSCHDTDSVFVYQYPDPDLKAGNDTSVCKNTYFRLYTQTPVGGSFSWTPQNKVYSSTVQNPFVFADSERIYKVVLTTADNCIDSEEIKVSVYPKPVANAGPDTGACMNGQVMLQGTGAGTNGSYFWYPGINISNQAIANPVITVNTNMTYNLVASTMYNCRDTDNVVIQLRPDPVANAGPDTSVCIWDEVQLKGTGGMIYRWLPQTGLNNPYTDTPRTIISGAATYQLTVYNQYGCSDVDSVALGLLPHPVADAGPDTTLCKGKRMNLNGNGGVTYHWFPDSLTSNPFIPNPLVVADKFTIYNLAVTNSFGCHDTDEMQITINPVPIADAGPDTIGCPGDIIILHGSGGGSYLWFPSSGVNDSTVANPAVIVNGKKTYALQVTNTYNCSGIDSVIVAEHPVPEAGVPADTFVCPGAAIALKGSGGGKYAWYPRIGLTDSTTANPIATIKTNMKYRLVVTNTYGCKDSAYVSIDTLPLLFVVDTPAYICKGDAVQLFASGGDIYQWHPGGLLDDSSISNPTTSPATSTTFTVAITETVCNRTDTFDVPAEVKPLPVLKIAVKDLDCARPNGELIATGAVEYSWSPTDGLDDPYTAHTMARPERTTRYFLTAIDKFGCTDTASAELKVFQGDGKLFIPDAFTPNGDGINDCYRVFVPGDVTSFVFSIYNRFGERVFHTSNPNDCWDGNYKGVRGELSTYFYYYEAISSVCGKVFRKGDMHLIR